jgi:hypothetical protein
MGWPQTHGPKIGDVEGYNAQVEAAIEDATAAIGDIHDTGNTQRDRAITRAANLVHNADALVQKSSESQAAFQAKIAALKRELALSVADPGPSLQALSSPDPAPASQPPLEVTGDIDDMDAKFTNLMVSGLHDAANTTAPSRRGKGSAGGAAQPPGPLGRKMFRIVRSISGAAKAEPVAPLMNAGAARGHVEGHDMVGRRESRPHPAGGTTDPSRGTGARAEAASKEDEELRRYKPHHPQPLRIRLPELPPEVMAAAAMRPAASRSSTESTMARRAGEAGGDHSDSDESITSPEYIDKDGGASSALQH